MGRAPRDLDQRDFTIRHAWTSEPDKWYTTEEFLLELKKKTQEKRRKLREWRKNNVNKN